jgi:hypothetical protein
MSETSEQRFRGEVLRTDVLADGVADVGSA